MKGRTLLGRDSTPILSLLIGYRLVFEIEDAVEVDEITLVTIERTRVYYDDVLGITYHRAIGAAFAWTFGALSIPIFIGLTIIAIGGTEVAAGGLVFILMGAPFAIGLFLRLLMKVDVITIYGKRTKACMKFGFRKAYAREVYRSLTAKIRARHAKALAEQPAPPPSAPEIPLPPPPPGPA